MHPFSVIGGIIMGKYTLEQQLELEKYYRNYAYDLFIERQQAQEERQRGELVVKYGLQGNAYDRMNNAILINFNRIIKHGVGNIKSSFLPVRMPNNSMKKLIRHMKESITQTQPLIMYPIVRLSMML